MEEALRAALLADMALRAIVADRINWGKRTGTLPEVSLTLVSGVPFYTFGGRDGLTPYRVQIDCWGLRYGDAKRAARAITTTIEGLSRPTFDSCFVEAERDGLDTDAAEQPVHRTSLDTRIWHHA